MSFVELLEGPNGQSKADNQVWLIAFALLPAFSAVKDLLLKLKGLMRLRNGDWVALGFQFALHGREGFGIAVDQEGPGTRSAAAVPPKQALLVAVA